MMIDGRSFPAAGSSPLAHGPTTMMMPIQTLHFHFFNSSLKVNKSNCTGTSSSLQRKEVMYSSEHI
jgi:hypothetical protein